jgi:hypothetical protein
VAILIQSKIDINTTTLRVVVRDAKMNKKDPILGIVTLDLQDLFKDRCQRTKLWALNDGDGKQLGLEYLLDI